MQNITSAVREIADPDGPETASCLSVCRVLLSDGKERHIIARLKPVNGGAAFEYHDPVTDEVVGSVGANRLDEFVTPLPEWVERNA